MKKTTIAGLSAAALAAGLGLGAGALANADTTSPTPSPSASSGTDAGSSGKPERGHRGGGHGKRGGFGADTATLAAKLGVTEDALKSALEKAREETSPSETTSPSEQTDEQRRAARETRQKALVSAVAKELNLDEEKVAGAVEEARAERTAEREASQKEKLASAVTDGKLTQAEADAVAKAIDQGIVELRGGPRG